MSAVDLEGSDWRPITFEGVTFPPTLMGISVLASIFGSVAAEDEELGGWLHSLRMCCGVSRRAPAVVCHGCATRARALMLEHRAEVVAGITRQLGPHGWDADATFRAWLAAMERIAELAAIAEGDCTWSAPGHASDPLGTPEKQAKFLRSLEAQISNAAEPVAFRPRLGPGRALILYGVGSLGMAIFARPGYDAFSGMMLLLGGPTGSLKLFLDAGRDVFDDDLLLGRVFSSEALGVALIALGIWLLGGFLVFKAARSCWRGGFTAAMVPLWLVGSAYNLMWFGIRSL
jgi:hypothetical protein